LHAGPVATEGSRHLRRIPTAGAGQLVPRSVGAEAELRPAI